MSAPPRRTLVDLDGDVLAHCARYLAPRDVASLAMACRPLRAAAYCDAVWYRHFREQWPFEQVPCGALGLRELNIQGAMTHVFCLRRCEAPTASPDLLLHTTPASVT